MKVILTILLAVISLAAYSQQVITTSADTVEVPHPISPANAYNVDLLYELTDTSGITNAIFSQFIGVDQDASTDTIWIYLNGLDENQSGLHWLVWRASNAYGSYVDDSVQIDVQIDFLSRTNISDTSKVHYQAAIDSVKSQGNWDELGGFMVFVTDDSASQYVNIIQDKWHGTPSGVSPPSYVVLDGAKGTGTGYVDIDFAESEGVNYQLNDGIIGLYVMEHDNSAPFNVYFGSQDGTQRTSFKRDETVHRTNSQGTNGVEDINSIATTDGELVGIRRNNSANYDIYAQGSYTNEVRASVGLPTSRINLMALNDQDVAKFFSLGKFGAFFWGSSLVDMAEMETVIKTLIDSLTYVAPPGDVTPPTISSFAISDANPDRVNFSSSEPITGSTFTGFTLASPSKTISQIDIAPGQTTGHYFTTTTDYAFGDAPTIAYDGLNDWQDLATNSLASFTATSITNNISPPGGGGPTVNHPDSANAPWGVGQGAAMANGQGRKYALQAWYDNPILANWPEMVWVDNTNASGAGSFTEAVDGTSSTHRFVGFNTGGLTTLTGNLISKRDNITIAANTAPSNSKGFVTHEWSVRFKSSNVFVLGLKAYYFQEDGGGDALAWISTAVQDTALYVYKSSIMGGKDGSLDVSKEGSATQGPKFGTVHYSMVAYTGEPHDLNSLTKYTSDMTFYKNIFAMANGRNNRIGLLSLRMTDINNFGYDYRARGGEIGSGTTTAWLYNVWKPGPGTEDDQRSLDGHGLSTPWQAYIEGNESNLRISSDPEIDIMEPAKTFASAGSLPTAGSDPGETYIVGPNGSGNYDLYRDDGTASYEVWLDAVLVGVGNKPTWVPDIAWETNISTLQTDLLANAGTRFAGNNDDLEQSVVDHINNVTTERWDGLTPFSTFENETWTTGTPHTWTGNRDTQLIPDAWLTANGFGARINQDNRGYIVPSTLVINGDDYQGWTLFEAWFLTVNL